MDNIGDELWTLAPDNRAPRITAIDATPVIVNQGGDVTLTATTDDPDGDTITHSWTSNIGGTFDDAEDRDTTWTAPTGADEAQVATLTLTVTDPDELSANVSVQVTVRGPSPTAVSLPSIDNQTGATGDLVDLRISPADNGLNPYPNLSLIHI